MPNAALSFPPSLKLRAPDPNAALSLAYMLLCRAANPIAVFL